MTAPDPARDAIQHIVDQLRAEADFIADARYYETPEQDSAAADALAGIADRIEDQLNRSRLAPGADLVWPDDAVSTDSHWMTRTVWTTERPAPEPAGTDYGADEAAARAGFAKDAEWVRGLRAHPKRYRQGGSPNVDLLRRRVRTYGDGSTTTGQWVLVDTTKEH